MAHNKSPGPDGFTAKSYQHFWDLVKNELRDLFDDLHRGEPKHVITYSLM